MIWGRLRVGGAAGRVFRLASLFTHTQTGPDPMILFTAADLIWGSRIKRTGESLGLSCRPVRSVAMLEDRLGEGGVTGLVLDLDVMELAESLVARLRGEEAGPAERAIRIIAFGPHVRTDLFERIREAGADEVMTRGAFDRTLPDLLLGLATSASSDQM